MATMTDNIDAAIRSFLEKAYNDQEWMASMGQDYGEHILTIDFILAQPDRARAIWRTILQSNTSNRWAKESDLDNALRQAHNKKEDSAFRFCKLLWLNLYH